MKNKLPTESDRVIVNLCKQYYQKKANLVEKYWEYYYHDIFCKNFSIIGITDTKRHYLTRELLRACLESREVVDRHTIVPIGKGPVSAFSEKSLITISAKVWVFDLTLRKKAVLDLPKIAIEFGILHNLQLFCKYPDIPITSEYETYLKTNYKIIDLPTCQPSNHLSGEFMKILSIPSVKMVDMYSPYVLSAKSDNDYHIASDIRCIKNCTVTHSRLHEKNVKELKYEIGNISITDYTTKGYTTKKGMDIPSKLFCWVNPEFVLPVGTSGNAYGVLKMNKLEEIAFDLCNFDVIRMGDEVDHHQEEKITIPYKSKKQKVKESSDRKRVSKKSTRKTRTIHKTKNLKALIKNIEFINDN